MLLIIYIVVTILCMGFSFYGLYVAKTLAPEEAITWAAAGIVVGSLLWPILFSLAIALIILSFVWK